MEKTNQSKENLEKERLERELKAKVLGEMRSPDEIKALMDFTLKNFSYRFLESDTTGLGVPKSEGQRFLVELFETNLATALKTQSKETRAGLIDLAKSFSKKDNPSVCYRMGFVLKHVNPQGGGDFEVFAEVNWDFPHFDLQTKKKNKSSQTVTYEDGFELRNNLARVLEEVCHIF